MPASHLTLRLTDEDASLMEQLRARTGMNKSDIVKHALRTLAANDNATVAAPQGLFALGADGFGAHGDVSRQSGRIKSVVRARLKAKRIL